MLSHEAQSSAITCVHFELLVYSILKTLLELHWLIMVPFFASVFHCSNSTNTLFCLNSMPGWYFSFSGLALASHELHSTQCFCLLLSGRINLFLFTDNTTDNKIGFGNLLWKGSTYKALELPNVVCCREGIKLAKVVRS